jgi:hypothetical protein
MSGVIEYVTTDNKSKKIKYRYSDTTLNLSNLDICQFDVSQLESNNNLRELRLNDNNMTRLDITPLTTCKQLRTLVLDGETEVETILSPFTMEDIAKEVLLDAVETYNSLSYLPSLNSIRISYGHVLRNEPDWKLIHLFHNALRVSDYGWMGKVDLGLQKTKQVLQMILDDGFTQEIHNLLFSFLTHQIETHGPTIDLDIESMKNFGDLVMLVDDVVEQRNSEMKNQYIPVLKFDVDQETIDLLRSTGESIDTHYADLRMLWLTSYGYEMLESLEMGTTCEMREFSMVREALSDLGFEVRTELDPNPYPIIGWKNRQEMRHHGVKSPEPKITLPKKLSPGMIEYIWQLAEFKSASSMLILSARSQEPLRLNLFDLE